MFFLPITWVHFDWSNNLETWSEQPEGPLFAKCEKERAWTMV